jgi:GTP cyclohydrolase I
MVSVSAGLVDLQATEDLRGVELCSVGVSGVRLPIRVLDPDRGERDTVATIRVGVDVPASSRGTHLSRFIEILNAHPGRLTLADLSGLLTELRAKQGAKRSEIEVEFDYFLRKEAPVSKAAGLMDYRCAFIGRDDGSKIDLRLRVSVPVATLCPCSKAISKAGAHNQRTIVTVETRSNEVVWIEEVVAWVEGAASCPLYPVLKRIDEKYVTERAYANPRFVEDVVRESIVRMREETRIDSVRVEAHSHESIHNHNAYAVAAWSRATGVRRR